MRTRRKLRFRRCDAQHGGKKLPQAAMCNRETVPVLGIAEARGPRTFFCGQQGCQRLALSVWNIQGKGEESAARRRLWRDGELPALRIDQRAMPARRGSSVFSPSVL